MKEVIILIEQAQSAINNISGNRRETTMAYDLLDRAIELLNPPEKERAIPTRKLDREKCKGCKNYSSWRTRAGNVDRNMIGCLKSYKSWGVILRLCEENKWYSPKDKKNG
ncbi:hypothetical protein FACS189447_03050 [Spirochaetia bacterium]|nr:hypothetical protein FACS189447_03050 [Spirochaetia bacterium]